MKDENVICVERKFLHSTFDLSKQYWSAVPADIDGLPIAFLNRRVAENDFEFKQLIPYAVVLNRYGEVLCYQRHGSEKRLSELCSVGIGGHVNDGDVGKTLMERLLNGLKREFEEEIGVLLHRDQLKLIGMIDEEETEVGLCHTGIVFVVKIKDENLSFDAEIGNPKWMRSKDLDMSKFELWSRLVLLLLQNQQSPLL